MRHFGSFLLAAIFGPAVFLLTGTGLSAFASARTDTFIDDPLGTLAALGALLLAGVLYGILIMVRLSPVGPGLAGLMMMGASGFALVAPQSYDRALGTLGVHMGGAVGQWGLGILLGVPLLATITSPRRWRREANPAPTATPYPGYPPNYPAPAYPVQQQRPSIPDETRQMPKQPEYMTLPDIKPPSLRYPDVPPGAPPPPPPSTARPAANTPQVSPGAPPPPPLSTAKPAVSPGAPPPPPLAAKSPAVTPGAPPPPPLSTAKPSVKPAPPATSGAPPPPPLSASAPAATAPGAPRLSDAAIPAETPPLPQRVPSPPPGEDQTVKISTEDEDRTRPLS